MIIMMNQWNQFRVKWIALFVWIERKTMEIYSIFNICWIKCLLNSKYFLHICLETFIYPFTILIWWTAKVDVLDLFFWSSWTTDFKSYISRWSKILSNIFNWILSLFWLLSHFFFLCLNYKQNLQSSMNFRRQSSARLVAYIYFIYFNH